LNAICRSGKSQVHHVTKEFKKRGGRAGRQLWEAVRIERRARDGQRRENTLTKWGRCRSERKGERVIGVNRTKARNLYLWRAGYNKTEINRPLLKG